MSHETTYVRRIVADVADFVVHLRTERGRLERYAITLRVNYAGAWHAVRGYDNAHGRHDMHRHTLSGGKQPAETFHHGTPSEAFNAARQEILRGYEEMIAGWLS